MTDVRNRTSGWVNVRSPTTFVSSSPSSSSLTSLPKLQKPTLIRLPRVVQTKSVSSQTSGLHCGTESAAPSAVVSVDQSSTKSSDGNAADTKSVGSTVSTDDAQAVVRRRVRPPVSEFLRRCYSKLLKDGTDEQKALIDTIYKLELAVTALDRESPDEMKYTMHISSNLAGTPQTAIEFDVTTGYTSGTNRGFSHSVFTDVNPGTQLFDRIGLQIRVHHIRLSFMFQDTQIYTVDNGLKVRDYPMRWIVWKQKVLSNAVVCDITPNNIGLPEQSGALLWDPFDTNPRTGTTIAEDTTVAAGYSPNAISRLNNKVYHDAIYKTWTGGAAGAALGAQPFTTWQRPNTTFNEWHTYDHHFPGGLRVSYLDDTTNNQAPIENDVYMSWVTDKPPYVASGTGTNGNRRYLMYRTEVFFTDA